MFKPATVAEVRASHESISNSLNNISDVMKGLSTTVTSISDRLTALEKQPVSFSHYCPCSCSYVAEPHCHNERMGQRQPLHVINRANIDFPTFSHTQHIGHPAADTFVPTAQISYSNSSHLPPPVPGLCIPDVPLAHNGVRDKSTSLSDIVFQWENKDPKLGLLRALKDWPKEWYTGDNKGRFAAKRYQQSLIALQYIEL